jgi:hypothetical protein
MEIMGRFLPADEDHITLADAGAANPPQPSAGIIAVSLVDVSGVFVRTAP